MDPRLFVMACSVCFGDPNSKQTIGLKNGVIVLGAFITFVLIFIGIIAFRFAARERALSSQK